MLSASPVIAINPGTPHEGRFAIGKCSDRRNSSRILRASMASVLAGAGNISL
ncbi:hypothetical protein [Candidatus Nitrotoga sp. BS]|uniref:hypothetical protein n=1 Tax=Candidatus Nitrotoga sp. BS TaxID=2890408 RepID=UPI001EF1E19B|nr:hypothetical protein [Candidatus Nitrotoga sp. BS]